MILQFAITFLVIGVVITREQAKDLGVERVAHYKEKTCRGGKHCCQSICDKRHVVPPV